MNPSRNYKLLLFECTKKKKYLDKSLLTNKAWDFGGSGVFLVTKQRIYLQLEIICVQRGGQGSLDSCY